MTPEQLKRLKEKQDEIITIAMGKCWHDSKDGRVALYDWLTKEKPELFGKLEDWYLHTFAIKKSKSYFGYFIENIENLSGLFVQWLAETKTGWWEECEDSRVLTPLGALMKEVLK